MHVAFWCPAWPLQKFQNGIITYVHWMKRELESQGHRVSVFTSQLDASAPDPAVHLIGRERGRVFSRAFNKHILRRRRKHSGVFDFGADIADAINKVHRHDPLDILEMEESFGWFADVARLTSLPLLVKLHGPAFLSMVEDELVSPLGIDRMEREGRALATLDSLVAPSELILRQTLDKYGLQPRDARRIVNPVVMDERTPLWSLAGCDTNSVLFVGRFDLRKGGDVVLRAFATAVKQNPHLSLVFVGPDSGVVGPDAKLIQFSEFRDSVLPAALRSRVDYRGRMPNEEITTLRTRSMLTVIASRWENQGYALLEAMFQGCPVVSTNAGGCPESVVDGVTGVLAESEDPESFARQILAVMNDPARAAALGRAARQHVMTEHAADKVVESALAMYAGVIAAHRVKRRSPNARSL
jgi:glycosyltransferase involved in cell wall biosynthesis